MGTQLNTREAAELFQKDERTIRRWAKSGKLAADIVLNETKSPEYRFPLEELPPDIQRRYHEGRKALSPAPAAEGPKGAGKPLDAYSAEEREEIAFWTRTVEAWQAYRARYPGDKAEADERFCALRALAEPERPFSVDTLYRRQRAVRENDLDGLVDKRGKWRKGRSSIPEAVWQAFLYYYLDQAQHPARRCYEYARLWARQEAPELYGDIPHYTTFTRHIRSDVPEPLRVLGREGEKAFDDRCAPYIRRVYDGMASNEYWIADNHTFDVITLGENGRRHRLYLTAFFDARSGIFTGCHVTLNPCSQATLIALRKGILKYGIPENIYVDNGREFLTFDIGGLGHRAKKGPEGQERFEPPPVFERLGIRMTNAIVRNAKAKIIERRFLDIKNQLSRLFETFTGGNVLEKPEKLKQVLKDGRVPLDGSFTETVEELLDWYFNQQPYGGAVAADRGKPRQQVYNENLHTKRVASAEDLNLMLMRSTRAQKVGRRGVHLDIDGYRLDYWTDEFVMQAQGREVYLRYDPDDLREVRVYDLEDRAICTLPVRNDTVCRYGDGMEEVKTAIRATRSMKKKAKEAMEASILPFVSRRTALELVLEQAHESKEARLIPPAAPKVLELRRPEEEPLLKAAGGGPDLDVMTRNAMKRKGEIEHE